jgi:imidazoleglycerol-phosphate dehydratase
MADRTAEVERSTKETRVRASVNLDGSGESSISTGIGFFDHMLEQLARHGLFDIRLQAEGDLQIDQHHTVEDVAIVLGQAFDKALGDKVGITRYGSATVPMDEALIMTSVDISGRGSLNYALEVEQERVGELPTDLVQEFFSSFARNAKITLHIRQLSGENPHHTIEAAFKSFARALSEAVSKSERQRGVPSTKGEL